MHLGEMLIGLVLPWWVGPLVVGLLAVHGVLAISHFVLYMLGIYWSFSVCQDMKKEGKVLL